MLCPKGYVQKYPVFKTERLTDPVYNEKDFNNIMIWFLTHNHEDHIDKEGIAVISEKATIIAHPGLRKIIATLKNSDIRFMGEKQETDFTFDTINISITALPAIHAKRKMFGKLIGKGNGYLLKVKDKKSQYKVYITGDSVYRKNTLQFVSESDLDLVITNAGAAKVGKTVLSSIIGRITNNSNDIKAMNAALHPRVLIPVHWGTFSHYDEVLNPRLFINDKNIRIVKVGESVQLT